MGCWRASEMKQILTLILKLQLLGKHDCGFKFNSWLLFSIQSFECKLSTTGIPTPTYVELKNIQRMHKVFDNY